ncbi:MAG: hypothetical protein HY537_05260 [Deltaproteobacteria bacterium]|nr:hypothetical protein [Deltaproteobacteria bacterium]
MNSMLHSDKARFAPFVTVLLILLWTTVGKAAGPDTVTVTVPVPPGYDIQNEQQDSLVAQLITRALDQWFQDNWHRYKEFEKAVATEFSGSRNEKYVVDYTPPRLTPDLSQAQMTVRVDSDSLKRWLRSIEAKEKGMALRPLFILSSDLLNLAPQDTALRIKDNVVAKTFFSQAYSALQKVGLKLEMMDLRSLPPMPPATESTMHALSQQLAGLPVNAALWVQIASCRTCGGTRMDILLYDLARKRILLARSEDLPLSSKDLSHSDRLSALFRPHIQQFKSEFEELYSSGLFFSQMYRLSLDDIENLSTFKEVEGELGRLDFVFSPALLFSVPRAGHYEIEFASHLSPQELQRQIGSSSLGRLKFKILS